MPRKPYSNRYDIWTLTKIDRKTLKRAKVHKPKKTKLQDFVTEAVKAFLKGK